MSSNKLCLETVKILALKGLNLIHINEMSHVQIPLDSQYLKNQKYQPKKKVVLTIEKFKNQAVHTTPTTMYRDV